MPTIACQCATDPSGANFKEYRHFASIIKKSLEYHHQWYIRVATDKWFTRLWTLWTDAFGFEWYYLELLLSTAVLSCNRVP